MTVDFFENQDKARRITGSLLFYFILGMLGIALLLCLVSALCTYVVLAFIPGLWHSWVVRNPWPFLGILSGTSILFILLCSRWKMLQLRKGGGQAIAEMLGGRLLQLSVGSVLETRLLHVVDEMAIAAGIPVPFVYVLPREKGINAFAAGYEPHYAVIGVTQGSLENLDRDELQGIVGHEFSHILNGDMRLNLQLIGWLHGITLIGQSGRWLLYKSAGFDRKEFPLNEEGNAFVPGIFLGGLLLTLGSLGTFFGDVIKASVCRQREYLADASAIEFTRNPDGLAGALKKIGGFVSGAALRTPNAAVASHMFFGQGVQPLFRDLLSTHPPLAERIRRIDPTWAGAFEEVNWALRAVVAQRATLEQTGIAFLSDPEILGSAVAEDPAKRMPGRLEQSYAAYKHRLLSGVPEELFHAARIGSSAPALVYAMLFFEQKDTRDACLDLLLQRCGVRVYDQVQTLASLLNQAGPCARLPLLDMSIPHLRNLDSEQFGTFRELVRALIRLDRKMTLFEWVVWNVIEYQLRRDGLQEFDKQGDQERQPLGEKADSCAVLLAALATFGERDMSMSRRMFERAAGVMRVVLPEMWRSGISLIDVDSALHEVATLTDKARKRLLAACVVCICENNEVSVAEGELLRCIAVRLDCPMPPLLPGQPVDQINFFM